MTILGMGTGLVGGTIKATLLREDIDRVLGEGFLPAGSEYTREFNAMYVHVGKAEDVPVLPPLLRSLYDRPSLWQNDGIHPTAAGHAIVAEVDRPVDEGFEPVTPV